MLSRQKILWSISYTVSGILMVIIGLVIYKIGREYTPDPNQLTSYQDVSQYLEDNWFGKHKEALHEEAIYIPTGVFLESLKFIDSNVVHASGYIWQKYDKRSESLEKKGVVLPEGTDITMVESYRRQFPDHFVIGWYFEANIIENFDYSNFPIDQQTVWLRMWHAEFDKNVVLIPDLMAYDSTKPADKFGIDPEIVLSGFYLMETFFKFKNSDYDTNFGIANYVGKKDFPELYFNVVVKRNVMEALVIYLLPLLVVIMLSFFGILLITVRTNHLSILGYNLNNVIGLGAMLLFIIILSHVQVRTKIFGDALIFIEYIYYVAYAVIVYSVSMAFAIDKDSLNKKSIALFREDGLWIKLTFLPGVFLIILIITIFGLR